MSDRHTPRHERKPAKLSAAPWERASRTHDMAILIALSNFAVIIVTARQTQSKSPAKTRGVSAFAAKNQSTDFKQ